MKNEKAKMLGDYLLLYFLPLTFWAWMLPGVVLGLAGTVGVMVRVPGSAAWLLFFGAIMAGYGLLVVGFVRYAREFVADAEDGEIPRDWLLRYLPLLLPVFYHLCALANHFYEKLNPPITGTLGGFLWVPYLPYLPWGILYGLRDGFRAEDGAPCQMSLIYASLIMVVAGMVFIRYVARERTTGAVRAVSVLLLMAVGLGLLIQGLGVGEAWLGAWR